MVICTEPAEGTGGMSITNSAEVIAARVLEANRLDPPILWIEHYEDGARGNEEDPETFDLVTFASYVPSSFVGPQRPGKRIDKASWKALDWATVGHRRE